MSVDTPSVFDRFKAICGDDGSDDVKAVEELAEEVGVKAVINARGNRLEGATCLMGASASDRAKTARQLIAWGADVEATLETGRTALFFVQSAEMVRLLVREGDAEVNVTDKEGFSTLSFNCMFDATEVTEALLAEGALVKFGSVSPLAAAAFKEKVDTMKVLLALRGFVRGIEWKGISDKTPREWAVFRGNDEMVALLDEALVVAKVWDRRLPVARVGLAAVDARVVREEAERKCKKGVVKRRR